MWSKTHRPCCRKLCSKNNDINLGFQTLPIQNLGEFQNSEDFEWFCWNSDQNSLNFGELHGILFRLAEHSFTGFPMSSMGDVWIFSGIVKFKLKYDNLENIKTHRVNTVVFNLHKTKQ